MEKAEGFKEPGKRLFAVCSILIPPNPLLETRQKTNYMAVEEFIFPDGQPEAIVHWQIKFPNTEKSSPKPNHVLNKKYKVCFSNKLFGNVEGAGESI